MKVLFVTLRFPYFNVNHAGGVYVVELIAQLIKNGVEVDILSFVNDNELQYVRQMECYFNTMTLIPSKKKCIERIIDLPYYFVKPRFIVDTFKRHFAQSLIKLQKLNQYDIIQFEWTQMSQYVKYVKKGIVTTLTEHDVSIIPAERQFLKQTKILKKIKNWWTLKLLKRYEPKQCTKFDLIFTLSDKDAKYLNAIDPRIETYPYPIFIKREQHPRVAPSNKNILFVANLGRQPNVEAITWFYHEVFVNILKDHSEAVFIIVGADPKEEILNIATKQNVQLFVNVKNPYSFYQQARVFVSPLKIGGGIIKKNLDAMASFCPLITTDIGNEGIGAMDGREVLIANTKEEFIRQLNRILTDDLWWSTISENAKEFIDVNYNFENDVERLIEKYEDIILTKKGF
jgi:glycosyltransferase involved in cell wall biosynthesis